MGSVSDPNGQKSDIQVCIATIGVRAKAFNQVWIAGGSHGNGDLYQRTTIFQRIGCGA